LYTYNFCTNKKTSVYNYAIYGVNSVSWSAKNEIYLLRGTAIKKMNADGSNVTKLFNKSSPRKIQCNPDGTLFTVTYGNYPAKDSVKIYTEEGDEIFTLPEPNTFLGWYDESHVLTSLDGQTIKTNIHTGDQGFFLMGEYYSYDYKTNVFLKHQDSLAFRKWIVINENGGIVNEMPYHYSVGSFKGVNLLPVFGLNNKLIVNLASNEFYPDKHTPSCGLKTGYSIIIMDMDGTNVRKVEFPE
ncbi:MAG TPA: hypothetical protein VKY33_07090, partial [Flavobacterium sp.]|nr:hypothetical protein [Flavobacterium sp.]